jgi:hypothetical protein
MPRALTQTFASKNAECWSHAMQAVEYIAIAAFSALLQHAVCVPYAKLHAVITRYFVMPDLATNALVATSLSHVDIEFN